MSELGDIADRHRVRILNRLLAAGGEAVWRTRADSWTRNLESQKTNTQTHDLGFKLFLEPRLPPEDVDKRMREISKLAAPP